MIFPSAEEWAKVSDPNYNNVRHTRKVYSIILCQILPPGVRETLQASRRRIVIEKLGVEYFSNSTRHVLNCIRYMKCARINHLVKLTRSLSESPLTTYYLKRSKEDIRQHVSRNTYQLLDFMSTYISITLAAKPRKVP